MVTTLQNLELVPGESLGPFHLGRTLFETLPLLRSSQTPVKVSWAQGVGFKCPAYSDTPDISFADSAQRTGLDSCAEARHQAALLLKSGTAPGSH